MTNWTGQDFAVVIGALLSGVAAIFSIWAKIKSDANAHELTMHQKRVEAGFAGMEGDIRQVRHATNSMKDALVEAAGKAGEAKGRVDEKADQSAIAAQVEQLVAKQPSGQIKVESADIKVDKAEITVAPKTKPVTEGDNPER